MRQQADGWQVEARNPELYSEVPQRSRKEGLGAMRLRWMETVASGANSGSASGLHHGESLAGLTHDARNMVASIDLYCDLLEEPGVLSVPFRHYAGELRLVAGASRRLLEKLDLLDELTSDWPEFWQMLQFPESGEDTFKAPHNRGPRPVQDAVAAVSPKATPHRGMLAFRSEFGHARAGLAWTRRGLVLEARQPIRSVADELQANRNLLSALAGPGISVVLTISGGDCPIAMAADDLTRVLVNLARNAADAMPGGGRLDIRLDEGTEVVSLTVSDNGTGIEEDALEAIFSPGYTGHMRVAGRPSQHCGLGLAIVRSLVAAAGGSVRAGNRQTLTPGLESAEDSGTGAVFVIEFPIERFAKT